MDVLPSSRRFLWGLAAFHAVALWLTGPLVNAWPLAFVALTPLVLIGLSSVDHWKRPVYLASFVYWLISLQGLRYAHPLMILPLLALAGYLAIYPILFVALLRRVARQQRQHFARIGWLPISLVAAALWVGGEWVRNYFMTGISVLMLGHALVDMPGPLLVQIADLLGTYAVSFVLAVANTAIALLVVAWRHRMRSDTGDISSPASWRADVGLAVTLLIATAVYGQVKLAEPAKDLRTTFVLIGLDEQTEYAQDLKREQEIFASYVQATLKAVGETTEPIDVIVWPESMLSGGMAWMSLADDVVITDELKELAGDPNLTLSDLRSSIQQQQNYFQMRSRDLLMAFCEPDEHSFPHLIGGCGIVQYGRDIKQFSGVLQINPEGGVIDTYRKNHLVLFGETIPLVHSLPIVRNWIPRGLGLQAGTEPAVFNIGKTQILPNLCIETAVERVAVNHLGRIARSKQSPPPEVIVTLTNDAWFDHSSVVSHHLRCSQMVAVGCRRSILSSANGGPTAWVDHRGNVIDRLDADQPGYLIAKPQIPGDETPTVYVRWGAWPASCLGIVFLATLLTLLIDRIRWKRRQALQDEPAR